MRVAFGPISKYASWSWVGVETATELEKHFEVSTFHAGSEPTEADVWVFVKLRPGADVLEEAKQHHVRTVYAPIDFYQEEKQLSSDEVLPQFDLVLAHSDALCHKLWQHCQSVERVEHHMKHGLAEIRPWRPRKPDDRIVWIDHHLNIPVLLEWLREHDTDRSIMSRITLVTDRSPTMFPETRDMKVLSWNERTHQCLLGSASGFIDIEGSSFHQRMKPPTKAQQYVWSGVPTAMNPESGPVQWFRQEGFELCDPRDQERWFSKAYWEEMRAMAETLRGWLTLEAVGERYRDILQRLVLEPHL